MHQIHNCKLISHMLNPHYRNVCACYNNKIFRIRKCQCYNELCSFGKTISLHMIDLIWFYNHSLRIRTRQWFSPKVIYTPCAKKNEIRQRQTISYKYKRPSTRKTTSSQHLSFLSFLSLALVPSIFYQIVIDPFIFSIIINIAASLIIEDVLLVHLTHDALIEDERRIKWTIGGSYEIFCRTLWFTLSLHQSGYIEVSSLGSIRSIVFRECSQQKKYS